MNLLTLHIRNLSAQSLRSALTIVGIAVAVAGFVALTGLTRGLENAYESGLGEGGGDLIVGQRGTYSLVSGSLSEDLGARFEKIAGVEAASGVILAIEEVEDTANVFVAGWPNDSFLWRSLHLVAGRNPTGRGEIVLGRGVAEVLGKTVGDDIRVQYEEFRVSGIMDSDSVFNRNIAVMRLPELQTLIGRPASVSLFQVRLSRPIDESRVGEVMDRLHASAKDISVGTSSEFAGNMQFVRTVEAIATTVSMVMLIASSILIANTLVMAVTERTQEFGILAALGWTPARVRLLVLTEGFVMSLLGSVFGVGAGIATMHAVSYSRIAAGLLEPYLTGTIVCEAIGWTLFLGPLAALYPAWRATRDSPSRAIRGLR